jgi:hypothetical protein
MKAYLESGGITPRILWLGTRRRWVVSFTPRPLYPPGKIPRYPSDRRLVEPQSRSERGGEEKNSQPLPGLEPPIIQLVAQRYATELSRVPNIIIDLWKGVRRSCGLDVSGWGRDQWQALLNTVKEHRLP